MSDIIKSNKISGTLDIVTNNVTLKSNELTDVTVRADEVVLEGCKVNNISLNCKAVWCSNCELFNVQISSDCYIDLDKLTIKTDNEGWQAVLIINNAGTAQMLKEIKDKVINLRPGVTYTDGDIITLIRQAIDTNVVPLKRIKSVASCVLYKYLEHSPMGSEQFIRLCYEDSNTYEKASTYLDTLSSALIKVLKAASDYPTEIDDMEESIVFIRFRFLFDALFEELVRGLPVSIKNDQVDTTSREYSNFIENLVGRYISLLKQRIKLGTLF